ncbi:MAG: tetratricopeptide repeat protein [Anaerolineales bacterium]|nr:tetratricopeptide repeat protein [Anaerolineales bacterium]
MEKLELTLLGMPQIKVDGLPVSGLASRKARALLIYLAMTRQFHSRQALAGLLWGDMTETSARRNLRVGLVKLRAVLEPFLLIRRRTLAINPDADIWLDVSEFERCLAPNEPDLQQLHRAAALYQGHFLDDFYLRDAPLFEDWIRPLQERYRQMAMDTLYRLAVYHTKQKQYGTGIDYAGRLLTLEPWMEEAHRQMMLLQALSGQRSAALAQYETCCTVLEEELGIEPSDTTIRLYQQILNEEIDEDEAAPPAPPPPAPPTIPFQVPAKSPHFVGRTAMSTQITAALSQPTQQQIHALVGMGGVGKSTLAVEIAHAVRHVFADGVLWADAARAEPMSVLESWAQAYGYDFTRIGDVESMAAAFRGMLADKSVLIVLDDVISVSRIRPLLPNGTHNHILLTTRNQDLARTLNAQVWPLQELSQENGRLLLMHILGEQRVEAEPEAAAAICTLLQNLPLAVEITAQRLKSRPRRLLADMAQRLQAEQDRLSLLAISDRAIRTSFAVSWETLDAAHRRIFALLGLFNGRSFTAEAIAHIAELDRYTTEDRLFSLAALSLLREDDNIRYRQHPLLADFAREQLGEDVGEENGRFASYYLHFAQKHQQNYDALRPEWDNMMTAMETAFNEELWQIVIDYTNVLHNAWFARARYTQARTAYSWAIKSAQSIQDAKSHSRFLLHHGRACLEQRDYDNAEKHFQNSLELFEQIGDQSGVAWNQTELARIDLERSQFEQAQRHIKKSREIWKQLKNVEGTAEAIYVEARIYYFLGDYNKAKLLAEQASRLQEESNDLDGLIPTLNLLATTALEQGELHVAEEFAQHALNLSTKAQNKNEEAMILDVLANVYRRKNELDNAKNYAEKSLELLATIGDLGSQAMAYYQLSLISKSQGQLNAALELGLKSLELSRISEYSLLTVYVLNHLGDYLLQLNNLSEARERWQEALKIGKSINNSTAIYETKRRLQLLEETS